MTASWGNALTIVKLGGSLLETGRMDACLSSIASAHGRVAVVPGGGPFADTVRREQAKVGFDEDHAHCMAVLAMAQMAYLIASRGAPFEVAHDVNEARSVSAKGNIPVWAPIDLIVERKKVAENWDMTSDSLAAWFASRMGAARLLLVKSAPHEPGLSRISDCASRGLVDPLLPSQISASAIEAFWIGDADAARMSGFLDGNAASAIALAA